MASSTCSMSVVIWKLWLTYTTIWIVSSSLCMVLSSASVAQGIDYVPLSYICVACICSKTCLISAKSFCILPLWLSATRSTSSSMILYSGICLWALAFLCGPPVSIIGHLGGPLSCGFVVGGACCIMVSPLPCSSCDGEFPLFPTFPSFFRELLLFCCVVF
jgi:hypothetical protein